MASQVQRPHMLANFKPSKLERLKTRARASRERRADRPGNSEAHLALIRQLPCCICGITPGGQAHHVKSAAVHGIGQKVPDKWTVPLCNECHIHGVERVGSRNELHWFHERGIDAIDLASALWSATGDARKMLLITIQHFAKGEP